MDNNYVNSSTDTFSPMRSDNFRERRVEDTVHRVYSMNPKDIKLMQSKERF